MKKVGIVGGMGPESTIPYYHDIVYGVQELVGKDYFPKLTIESINVFDVLEYCRLEKYDELTNYLEEAIHNLCKCHVDFIVLAANTPHIVYDRLVKHIEIPIISIVEETVTYAKKKQMKKIGLLGTRYTMEGEYYKAPFIRENIYIVVPKEDEITYVSKKISEELEYGIINEETRKEFYSIIQRMVNEDKIEGIILGCTELPLLIEDAHCPVSCLDSMDIHIKAIIDKIVE